MRNFQILVLILTVNEIAGDTNLTKNVSVETKDSLPPTTSIRMSSILRDVLNQESLVRFSMVQQIQKLAMDVTEIKKDKQTLERNLNDVMNELQTLEINNQRLRQENDILKENVTDLYSTRRDNTRDTGKDSPGYDVSEIQTMQKQISVLQNDSDGLAVENANLKEQLGVLETVGLMRLRNEYLTVNPKYLSLLKENVDFKLQLDIMNATMSQTRDLGEAIENKIQKLQSSTEASLNDIRDDLIVSTIKLQNVSAEIWEVREEFLESITEAEAMKKRRTECPKGWERYGKSCYMLNTKELTWSVAAESCRNLSAYLAEIDSREENDFIHKMLKEKTSVDRVWLGGTDTINESTWIWNFSGSPLRFKHWAKGEPNDSSGKEDCMEIRVKEDDWNDNNCSKTFISVCERDLWM